jgi:hypothetical protein
MVVANLERDELRALALSRDESLFVRAPNPLFPLAVPTARWPRAVASFTTPDGSRGAGLLFALSTAASQVSVVATDSLAFLGSFTVPDTALALAVVPHGGAEPISLVVASAQADAGALYVISVSEQATRDPSLLAAARPTFKANLGRSRPQALAISPSDPALAVVGDRQTGADGLGRQGGLALVSLATGSVQRFDVGGPVSALAIDGRGETVFGVIDSEACETDRPCGGVFAFSLAGRELRPDKSASPMPIPGVARGIAAGGAASVTLSSDVEAIDVAPLVVVSSTNGSLYLLDGGLAGIIDSDPERARTEDTYHLEPDGTRSENANGPTGVQVAEGAARTERVTVTFEGVLPSLKGRKGAVKGLAIEADLDFGALGVRRGDLLVLEDAPSACKSKEATVGVVDRGLLGLSGFDPGCLPSTVRFTIRAAGHYVVAGAQTGLMGRALANTSFEFKGRYFHRAKDFDPAVPALRFKLGPGDPRRDARFVLEVRSGVAPFAVPVDAVSMPTALAFDPVRGLFYSAYLGGNGLVELKPSALRHGRGDLGVSVFR